MSRTVPVLGPLPPGTPSRFGPYVARQLIGEGSTSMVLLAEAADGQPVAIKWGVHFINEAGRQRFRREVEACSRLVHPTIIRIFEVGELEGYPWFASAYHGPVTLRHVLQACGPGNPTDLPSLIANLTQGRTVPVPPAARRPLPLPVALDLLTTLAEGVAHAHGLGLVHRDLKPENVLLTPEGRPVICDFGLVLGAEERDRLTRTGIAVGTLGYQAPGIGGSGESADVFALGMMLLELTTGCEPANRRLRPHERVALDGPAARLGAPLQRIIRAATHPDPAWRYRNAHPLMADLQRLQAGEPVRARAEPRLRRAWAALLNHPKRTAAAVILAGLLPVLWWSGLLQPPRTWSVAIAELSLAQAADVQRLHLADGAWEAHGEGLRPRSGAELVWRQPEAMPLRLEAVIRDAPQCELFVGRLASQDGYVAGFSPDLIVLRRGSRHLALAAGPGAGAGEHRLGLEVCEDQVAVRLDGRRVLSISDPQPLTLGEAGLRLDRPNRGAIPLVLRFGLWRLDRPPALTPLALARRLVAGLERLPEASRRQALAPVRTACRACPQSELAVLLESRALLLAAIDDPQRLAEVQTCLAAVPAAQRRLPMHLLQAELGWRQGAPPAGWIDPLRIGWHDESQREAILGASLDLARTCRDPRPLATVFTWSLDQAPSPQAQRLLAEALPLLLPWHRQAVEWSARLRRLAGEPRLRAVESWLGGQATADLEGPLAIALGHWPAPPEPGPRGGPAADDPPLAEEAICAFLLHQEAHELPAGLQDLSEAQWWRLLAARMLLRPLDPGPRRHLALLLALRPCHGPLILAMGATFRAAATPLASTGEARAAYERLGLPPSPLLELAAWVEARRSAQTPPLPDSLRSPIEVQAARLIINQMNR